MVDRSRGGLKDHRASRSICVTCRGATWRHDGGSDRGRRSSFRSAQRSAQIARLLARRIGKFSASTGQEDPTRILFTTIYVEGCSLCGRRWSSGFGRGRTQWRAANTVEILLVLLEDWNGYVRCSPYRVPVARWPRSVRAGVKVGIECVPEMVTLRPGMRDKVASQSTCCGRLPSHALVISSPGEGDLLLDGFHFHPSRLGRLGAPTEDRSYPATVPPPR